jgi:MraZ protein
MDFYDTFEHTIDGKGRLVLPSSFRAAFADGGFMTFLAEYAALFTPAGWKSYRHKLEGAGTFTRKEKQYMFSFVAPFVPDSQNRISLGPRLRNRAGLVRDVTLVGSGSHVAVYARDTWAQLEASIEAPVEGAEHAALVDKIQELDFL